MKKRLYMRPRRPPKWWPREPKKDGSPGRKFAFVGVLKDGAGWCVGDGDLMTERQIEIARQMIRMEFEGCELKGG